MYRWGMVVGLVMASGSLRAEEPCVDEPEPPAREASEAMTHTIPEGDVAIGDVVCMGQREVWRDGEGRLRVCTVAEAVTLYEIPIAAEAYTHFHANGRPQQTTLARPMTLETASGLEVPCAAEHVSLSETGHVTHAVPETSLTIGSVSVRAGEGVAFHEDGSLWRATLEEPLEVLGTTFAAGTSLSWFASGEVSGGWLREPQTVGGYPIRSDFTVYPSGQLHTFELAEPRRLAEHDFPAWSKLELRRNGTLQRASYVADEGFLPHGEQWTDTLYVTFDCEGQELSSRTEHWQAPSRPPKRRK